MKYRLRKLYRCTPRELRELKGLDVIECFQDLLCEKYELEAQNRKIKN